MRQSDDNILLMLGRLEGKVDAILASRAEDREAASELEDRVGSLERKWAYGLGLGTAVSTVFATLLSSLSSHWKF